MASRITIVLLTLSIGVALPAPNPDIEESLKSLNINGLPNDLDLNNITNSIKAEDVEQLFIEKCKTNSGSEDAYHKAKDAVIRAQECVKNILDFEQIQNEVEEAKPKGDLDVVFKKYCQQAPTLKQCFFDLTSAYEPCLEEGEVDTKNTAVNVTDSLVDFVCHKDGDRIALFIAEGGPDCLNASAPAVRGCVEKHFNLSMGAGENPTLESLPLLLLKTDECEKFVRVQKCVVAEMDKCPETTPGNVVESLFNFIKKQTPCKGFELPKELSSGSACLKSVAVLVATALSLFLAH